MIESLPSDTSAFLVAKNGIEKLALMFQELQGWNNEFKLITLYPITETCLRQSE